MDNLEKNVSSKVSRYLIMLLSVVFMILIDNATTRLVGAWPNVYKNKKPITFHIELNKTANVRIILYDLKGELVYSRTLLNAQNKLDVLWEGTDSNGNKVTSGIYLYRVKVTGDSNAETSNGIILVL